MSRNSESLAALSSAANREISKIEILTDLDPQQLELTFSDGSKLNLADWGQSCCEYRHMSTDDDLSYYIGAKFLKVEIENGPDGEGDEYHEQQFMRIYTDRGVFVMVNHNEHNGYYGGFSVGASFLPPQEAK